MSQNSLILSKSNLSTVSVVIGFPVGAVNEEFCGITQAMISHMQRNTETKGEEELAQLLDRNGIVPFSNTGKTSSYIGLNTPPQKLSTALAILEEIIFKPEFKEDTLMKILQQQKGSLQQLEQIAQARLFQRTRWESAFGSSRIARNPGGTMEDLENIDVNALNTHYAFLKEHKPKFLAVGIDIEESMFNDTTDHLNSFGNKEINQKLNNETVPTLNAQVDKMTQKTGNSYIGINMYTHGHSSSNYEDVILDNLLSGGFSSRMFMEIRDKRNLSYGAFSINSKQKDFGLFTAAMDVSPDRATEAIEVALEVMKGVLTEDIPKDEMTRAVKSAQKTALFVSDSSQNYAGYLIGRLMAGLETDLDKINEKIKQAVDLEWQETMKKFFTKNNLTLGIAGEPGEGEDKWHEIVERVL